MTDADISHLVNRTDEEQTKALVELVEMYATSHGFPVTAFMASAALKVLDFEAKMPREDRPLLRARVEQGLKDRGIDLAELLAKARPQ